MLDDQAIELGVSEFVALLNQTLDFAYPSVVIQGELANLRVSKNRWVYFDLKDETASVKFFGTIYQLPGPLEDGMLVKVRGQPRLHALYGFSVDVLSIQPAGEGTIRRAAELLKAKLVKEGLFDESRKRPLLYPPSRIGLITSKQSAAYADFVKILSARWRGVAIDLIDVQVQGEIAPNQIIQAIGQFNAMSEPPEVLIIIRGGGSAEDLAAFSNESVTRAVAGSRVPTLVAIGHEIDLSLAELAADKQASTPSNAAELLVPDRRQILAQLNQSGQQLDLAIRRLVGQARTSLQSTVDKLTFDVQQIIKRADAQHNNYRQLLAAFNPQAILGRGYAVVRDDHDQLVRNAQQLKVGAIVKVRLAKGDFTADVTKFNIKD